MSIYLTIIAITAILAFLFNSYKKNRIISFLIFVLSTFLLWFVLAFRKGIGTDYYTYFSMYYFIDSGIIFLQREFLNIFYVFIKCIHLFFDDCQWLFIITSFLFIILFSISIVKVSKSWSISYLILMIGGYYFASMSNIRQWLAISCITVALPFMVDRKYIRGLLFCFFGFCFHSSTLIIIPFVILSCFNNLKKYGRYISCALLILTPLYLLFISLLKDKIGYEGFFMLQKSPFLMIYIIPYSFILFLIIFYYDKLCDVNPYTFGLTCIFTMGVVFSLLSCEMSLETTIRLTNWFLWPLIYLIPSFLKINKNKIVSYSIVTILIVLLAIISADRIGFNSWYEVLPYRDIWGHVFY